MSKAVYICNGAPNQIKALQHDDLGFSDSLQHAKKGEERPNHKYTAREWVNGTWKYIYDNVIGNKDKINYYDDLSNKYQQVQKVYDNKKAESEKEQLKLSKELDKIDQRINYINSMDLEYPEVIQITMKLYDEGKFDELNSYMFNKHGSSNVLDWTPNPYFEKAYKEYEEKKALKEERDKLLKDKQVLENKIKISESNRNNYSNMKVNAVRNESNANIKKKAAEVKYDRSIKGNTEKITKYINNLFNK